MDLLRVVATIGVVTIHSAAWIVPVTEPPTHGPVALIAAFARFSVPAFLVASGLVLFRAYGRPDEPVPFLKRRWLRVLAPWLIWTPVYLVFYVLAGELKPGPRAMADWLVSGPGLLYFLLLIAQCYLLLLVMPRSTAGLVLFTACAFAVQLPLDWVHTYRPVLDGWPAWPMSYLAQEEFPFWIGYFALGCLIGAEYDRIRARRRWWPVAAVVAALSMVLVAVEARHVPVDTWTTGLYAFFWPSMIPLTVSTVCTLLWLGHRMWRLVDVSWPVVSLLSRCSLGIYLVHSLLLEFAGPMTGHLPPLPRLAAMVVASVAVATLVVALISRTRLGALAVGETAKPRAPRRPASPPTGPGRSRGMVHRVR